MKKIILMLIAAGSLPGTGNAQGIGTDSRDWLQFGLKAGTNYSNVYNTKGEQFNADPKFGWVAGGFLAVPIGRYIGIQPEVLFSQKGFRATGSIFGNAYSFTRTTNYIDVPIFLVFKPSPFFSILAGPQYSYLLKQKDVFKTTATSTLQEQEFKNDNVRKNTLSFTGGFDINIRHFVFGARAGWDVQNNNGDGTSSDPRYKNVWYQASLGYRFHLN